jgi:hypothetical protein
MGRSRIFAGLQFTIIPCPLVQRSAISPTTLGPTPIVLRATSASASPRLQDGGEPPAGEEAHAYAVNATTRILASRRMAQFPRKMGPAGQPKPMTRDD